MVAYEPDGSWVVVIARSDPGHPNWVSTQGHSQGPHLLLVQLASTLEPSPARWFSLGGGVDDPPKSGGPPPRQRIAPVHITDYADPQFGPDVAAMIEAAKPLADLLPLEVDAICDQAAAELSASGRQYSDFGEVDGVESFRVRMAALLDAYAAVPELSHMGRITVHTLFTQLVRNRMLIADLLAQHPEIPRSRSRRRHHRRAASPGTTHLHTAVGRPPAVVA